MDNRSLWNKRVALAATGVIGLCSLNALGQSAADPASPSTAAAADNTKSNKLDPSNRSATADAQKENSSDRAITQQIRKSVMADKSLSTYAHNVKIVAIDGNVTLNGVVRSDQEKTTLESKAAAVVGASRVVNELKVSPKG